MLYLSHLKSASHLVLALGCVALAVSTAAQASPSGPSARRAAQLKKSAPGWLSHYLPDDRYKIDGKVWRYVSTDLDTYYHRPDSPNMLRQPAERVIGFASAKDAEEAGYKADPSDGTAAMAASSLAPAGGAMGGMGSLNGGPITLSDGVSTITLPKGWTHVGSRPQTTNRSTFTFDMMTQPQTKGFALIGIITQPGVNFSQQLSPTQVQSNLDRFGGLSGSGGRISTASDQQFANWAATAKTRSITMGGLKGISVSLPARGKDGVQGLTMVARGDKMFVYVSGKQGGGTPPDTRALIKSFRAR